MAPRTLGQYSLRNYVHGGQTRAFSPPFEGEVMRGAPMTIGAFDYLQVSQGEVAEELTNAALQGAAETFAQIQKGFFPLHERLAFLKRLQNKLIDQRDYLAQVICLEVGKPVGLAEAEVDRAISILEWTLIEAPKVMGNEHLPTEANSRLFQLAGWVSREPRGPLLAISPFNYPLNLVMHKLAPAIAAGCPVILKPSPKGAVTALVLGDLCHSSELPAGMLSVLNCDEALSAKLIRDPRVSQVSFTGSASVGWKLKAMAPEKVFALELGGTAPGFVDEGADLAKAADSIINGAMIYSGQVCISLQNLWCHPAVESALKKLLVERMERLPWGNPWRHEVIAGPVIDEQAAVRILKTRDAAIAGGARILAEAGPALDMESQLPKNFVKPMLMENLKIDSRLACEEIFGPVLNFMGSCDLSTWIDMQNAKPYRFQACVFSKDLARAIDTTRLLKFGGVVVNDSSALRFDPAPYGGRGQSGVGREGPASAMREFTEQKSVLIRI